MISPRRLTPSRTSSSVNDRSPRGVQPARFVRDSSPRFGRNRQRLLLIVRHENRGDRQPLLQLPNLPAQVLPQPRIQIAQRFIQKQHRGRMTMARASATAAADRHSTAADRVRRTCQAAPVQRLLRLTTPFAPPYAPHLQPEPDIVHHRQMRKQRIALKTACRRRACTAERASRRNSATERTPHPVRQIRR